MFRTLLENIQTSDSADKILETYKVVETDKVALLSNGVNIEPVVTLADEYGGRAQIGIDDHCYVLYLKQSDGTYEHVSHVFPEAHEALRDLPSPKLVEQEDKSVTKTFKVTTATPDTMKRFERFLCFLHYNGGHTGTFAMSFDGDGHEKMTVEPAPDKELADGMSGVAGADVEIARDSDDMPFAGMRMLDDSLYNVDKEGNKVEE